MAQVTDRAVVVEPLEEEDEVCATYIHVPYVLCLWGGGGMSVLVHCLALHVRVHTYVSYAPAYTCVLCARASVACHGTGGACWPCPARGGGGAEGGAGGGSSGRVGKGGGAATQAAGTGREALDLGRRDSACRTGLGWTQRLCRTSLVAVVA